VFVSQLPEEQLVARPGGASGGVGLYSFAAQPVQLQHQQHHTLPVAPQQHHRQTITVPPTQPVLASAGLVLVPATQQTNAAGAPFVWQVSPSSFSPSLAAPCSQTPLAPTENPAFFRVAASGLSAALDTACNQATAFSSSLANATAPHIATTAIHILPDYVGQHSPEPMAMDHSPLPASSSIPDIVLTGNNQSFLRRGSNSGLIFCFDFTKEKSYFGQVCQIPRGEIGCG
jgi:hypothetical protein